MKTLTVTLEELDGVPAAFLWAESDIPGAPPRHMVFTSEVDAGHIAAMAQYMVGGSEIEVVVGRDVMDFLRQGEHPPDGVDHWPLADDAARRGIPTFRTPEGVRLVSHDGSCTVTVCFESWLHSVNVASTT